TEPQRAHWLRSPASCLRLPACSALPAKTLPARSVAPERYLARHSTARPAHESQEQPAVTWAPPPGWQFGREEAQVPLFQSGPGQVPRPLHREIRPAHATSNQISAFRASLPPKGLSTQ